MKPRNKNRAPWFVLVLMVVFVVLLFVFKNSLIDFTSAGLQHQISPVSKKLFADSVDQLYNYSRTNRRYRYTLLEFSGAGCINCRKMEKELAALKLEHRSQIHVVSYQMTHPGGLQWGKYFGVVMIPTQIILDRTGREIFRNTGFISKEDLLHQMEKK